MITKDYQGNTLPLAYGTTVQGDNREWLAKLLMNGTELSCGIKKIEITKGSCGSDTEFTIGNVISSMLVAEVLELTDDVKGEDIEVRIGLNVSGVYSWVSIGTFTIATVEKTIYSTTLTGYGTIVSKGGISFPDLTAPTIAQVGAYIGTELGCTVTLDANIDDTLTIGQPMVGLTTYQALQVLANTVGGYAIDTADGNVKICLYDDTTTHSVNAGLMVKLPDVEEQDFSITGVRVTVSAESYDVDGVISAVGYESATPINLLAENPYMTQDLFDDMESHIVGYTYRPANIGLTLGDPRIEGDDVLSVTDADGSVYVVPCHSVKHIYTGGLATEVLAVRPTNSADGIGSISPIQAKLDTLNSGVVTARSEASKAQTIANDTKQHFWFWETIPAGADPDVGTGAHISDVSEEDFNDSASPLYHTGGNLLARSNGIAVRDGLTELATFGANGVTVGRDDTANVELGATSFKAYDEDGAQTLEISSSGVSVTKQMNEYLYKTGATATVIGNQKTLAWTLKHTITGSDTFSIEFYSAIGSSNYVYQHDISLTSGQGSFSGGFTNASGHFSFTIDVNGNAVSISWYTTTSDDLFFPVYRVWYVADGYAPIYMLGDGSATGAYSTAMGRKTTSSGYASVAEGINSRATANYSHAEGDQTLASAPSAHAEGRYTEASGSYAHAEGNGSYATDNSAHAEGYQCFARGYISHAEGESTTADGRSAHSQNKGTKASSANQTALGRFNVEDTADTYAVIVGNGTDNNNRSNALTVDWVGDVVASGGATLGDDLDVTGDVKASGHIYAEGHTNYVGASNSYNDTKTINSGTSFVALSGPIQLSAGTFILVGTADFPVNGTGTRAVVWYDGSSIINASLTQVSAVSGFRTRIQSVAIVKPSAITNYTLDCYQNSTSALSVNWHTAFIRIA